MWVCLTEKGALTLTCLLWIPSKNIPGRDDCWPALSWEHANSVHWKYITGTRWTWYAMTFHSINYKEKSLWQDSEQLCWCPSRSLTFSVLSWDLHTGMHRIFCNKREFFCWAQQGVVWHFGCCIGEHTLPAAVPQWRDGGLFGELGHSSALHARGTQLSDQGNLTVAPTQCSFFICISMWW